MKTEWVPKLMDDSNVNAISASKEDFVSQVVNHSTYKPDINRCQVQSYRSK